MLTKQESKSLVEITELAGNCNIFLFGKSLRRILMNDNTSHGIDVFIQTTSEKKIDQAKENLEKFCSQGFRFHYGPEIPISIDALFTIDTVYCDVKKLIEGDTVIESKIASGIKDLSAEKLKLIKQATDKIDKKPLFIFDAILTMSETGFALSYEALETIFTKRHLVKQIDKKQIFRFLLYVFLKSEKLRKVIATINTLGLSMELFGCDLVESAILNHLKKNDIFEFFALIFNNVDQDELGDFLIDRVGFPEMDVEKIINIIKAIDCVEEESPRIARKILHYYGKNRIKSAVNLFKSLGFKDLSKMIKDQKDAIVSINDLDISEEDIRAAFGLEDRSEIISMMNLALEKVLEDPTLNNKAKLLIFMNKQSRESTI